MRLHFAALRRSAALAAALVGLGTAAFVVPTASAATAADAPASHRPVAQRIELVRTGGIAGAETRFVIDRTGAGRDAMLALRLAGSARFRALAPAYQPENPCCDHFQYEVTVTYADGATKTVTTWSNAGTAPRVLRDVIRLTERVGVQPPPPPNPTGARRIDLVRSGGIAGQRVVFAIDPANTAPGAVRALEVAGSPEFRALDSRYQPPSLCCDRFQYDLTVTHADGTTQTVRTWSGTSAPAVLFDVIRLTEQNGKLPPA